MSKKNCFRYYMLAEEAWSECEEWNQIAMLWYYTFLLLMFYYLFTDTNLRFGVPWVNCFCYFWYCMPWVYVCYVYQLHTTKLKCEQLLNWCIKLICFVTILCSTFDTNYTFLPFALMSLQKCNKYVRTYVYNIYICTYKHI